MGIVLVNVGPFPMPSAEAYVPSDIHLNESSARSTFEGVRCKYFGGEEGDSLLVPVSAIMECPRGAAAEAVESASAVTAGAPQDRDDGSGDGVKPYLHVDHPSPTIPQHTRAMSTALHPSPSAVYALVAESKQSECGNKCVPSPPSSSRGDLMTLCSLPSTSTGDQTRHRQHPIVLPVRTCWPDLLGL